MLIESGTEAETVPITTQPGESLELACPDNNVYYHWQGKGTSAQYYINNKGVSEAKACQWGDGSDDTGNWAPVNLGVGFDGHASQLAYISIFPNKPTNPDAKLDFTVEFVADPPESLIDRCKYSNGHYLAGNDYSKEMPDGCTVRIPSCSMFTLY
jgi:SUN family beta-glucosidase